MEEHLYIHVLVHKLEVVRFTTDPNEGGVEKLAVAEQFPQFGMVPAHRLCLSDMDGGEVETHNNMADPHSFFFVKGWSRMYAAYSVLLCCYERDDFLQAGRKGVECNY